MQTINYIMNMQLQPYAQHIHENIKLCFTRKHFAITYYIAYR